jgi:hypothetical protein
VNESDDTEWVEVVALVGQGAVPLVAAAAMVWNHIVVRVDQDAKNHPSI